MWHSCTLICPFRSGDRNLVLWLATNQSDIPFKFVRVSFTMSHEWKHCTRVRTFHEIISSLNFSDHCFICEDFPTLFFSIPTWISLQNDEVAKKESELRQQKALAAEEERRRMNLLNALSRDHTTTDDSESFCTYQTVFVSIEKICQTL